ncbi:flavodoxin family protein [Polynucleobacter sp. AP-Titi-500A-B4]|uniref:flavodoxin family protein n=1 Tax=Polynucleobacter sp. AP-Titi-500A-B4 TaxID=2576923 RepID=UPI001BFD5D11|nr:flavodoxin family protein [Polynucleobacter sp. AP-Titi-500A-B4]QWE11660.1 flavodoxin family protein [Polynucleobacter sp. AP-Titi-500A-B4]
MKVCVLVGSSRKNGLSSQICCILKHRFRLKGLFGNFIHLADRHIEYCDADNHCQLSPCGVPDDLPSILSDMQAADGIIYMPVMHAFGTNSKFQAFLERAGYGYLRPLDRPLKDKVASIVVVGRRYGHTAVYSQIMLNIMLNKMIMAGSGFPPLFLGALGGVQDDFEALEALEQTIDRMHDVHQRFRGANKSLSSTEL